MSIHLRAAFSVPSLPILLVHTAEPNTNKTEIHLRISPKLKMTMTDDIDVGEYS